MCLIWSPTPSWIVWGSESTLHSGSSYASNVEELAFLETCPAISKKLINFPIFPLMNTRPSKPWSPLTISSQRPSMDLCQPIMALQLNSCMSSMDLCAEWSLALMQHSQRKAYHDIIEMCMDQGDMRERWKLPSRHCSPALEKSSLS